jgi:hypothetical protein
MSETWREELRALIDRQCEETLTDAEAARLDELVCRDEEACQFYYEYTSLLGMLFLEHAEEESAASILANWVDSSADGRREPRSGSAVLGFWGDLFQAGVDNLGRPFVVSMIFALGMPGLILTVLLIQIGSQRGPEVAVPRETATSAAQVIRMHQCMWEDPKASVSAGQWLSAGRQLRLRRGMVELRFGDGARVILEGPATFDAQNARQGFLQIGRLTANVPIGAEGFAIETPLARVVDLGTDFGVSVQADGTSETHVFEGEVEVAATQPSIDAPPVTRRLRAGEAVEVKPSGDDGKPRLAAFAAEPARFVRRVPGSLPEPTIIFAHRGANNPVTEGWRLKGGSLDTLGKNGFEVGPVVEDGIAAWSFRKPEGPKFVYYDIIDANGLTPALMAEAKEKGWVLRARVWMNERFTFSGAADKKYPCLFTYRDDELTWGFSVAVNRKGEQCLRFHEDRATNDPKVISISGSRNRYVDYEVRYDPVSRNATVFANGRRVGTRPPKPRIGDYANIRFGMRQGEGGDACDMRFAQVEWGILRGEPDQAVKPPGADRDSKPGASPRKQRAPRKSKK